jgi:membrane fusion protein
MVKQPLFRNEVVAERQAQWLGTVLLASRPSHRLFAAFAGLATVGVLGLLFFADFTRKARIDGLLVPQQGLVQVFAPQAGVVTELFVKEGAEVHKGERLLALSAELQSTALGATQSEIARRLAARRDSLGEERRELEKLGNQQARSLSDRREALLAEEAQLDGQIALQKSRLRLAEASEGRQRELQQRGFSSDQQLQQAEGARLEQESTLRELERSRIVAHRERLTLEGELRDLPIKSRAQVANLEREIEQLQQQLAETEARREIVIPAPEDGTITAIQAERGGRASVDVPLLSVVPAGAQLEAHMFCPSRAVGFLRPGQRVLLRYQAYPYQKFGHYDGVLENISRSAINPSALPTQLAGLTSLFGSSEPVYSITVSLKSQTITAYGAPVPLQAGMLLEADVVIERRRLIEWVLDPLYTLTGKWQG